MLVDRAVVPAFGYNDPDADSNGGTVGSDTHELHGDPVVAEPGVFEERVIEFVPRKRAAHLLEDVLIAVMIKVGEYHRVALL